MVMVPGWLILVPMGIANEVCSIIDPEQSHTVTTSYTHCC